MKKILYIQPRIEVLKIKGEYIMAEYSGAMSEKNGMTDGIPFNGKGSSNTADGADLGAKGNFSLWEDDADDSMNW